MSSTRIQRLNALLKRVEDRRAQPRLAALPSAPQAAAAAPAEDLFAPTIPPSAPTVAPAPVAAPPPAARAPSLRPEPEPARRPSISPLEDAMAQLGDERDEKSPLPISPAAFSVPAPERASLPTAHINQDLVLTHRPEAGPHDGPIVELVQPKTPTTREPTIQFDTGIKANPLTQRDLRPIVPEPAVDAPLTGPTHKLEPTPLPAHAAPARAVSAARSEQAKTFGELLELSLGLRPLPPR